MSKQFMESIMGICLLDPACEGVEHSINCRVMNRERTAVLLRREQEKRLALIKADIAGNVETEQPTEQRLDIA